MQQFLQYTILGLVVGGVYFIAASGLVVTYTTSGIFNFAQGAIAMLAAFMYWQVRWGWGWPAPIALIVVLFVFAPLLGAVLYQVVMKNLRGTSEVTKIIVPVGVMLGFLSLAVWIWNPQPRTPRLFYKFFGANANVKIFGINITWHEIIAFVLAIVIAGGIAFLFRRTRSGVAMRAVVDDPDLLQLNGGRPERLATISWAGGAFLAALAGILITPIQGTAMSANALTLLVIDAFAAAMFGRLKSLPRTFVGAIVLGLSTNYVIAYFPANKWTWTGAFRSSIPMILLFVILLILPQDRLRGTTVLRSRERFKMPTLRNAWIAALVLGVAVWALRTIMATTAINTLAYGITLGIIALSLVLLTGYAGEINLAALSFGAIGTIVVFHFGVTGTGNAARMTIQGIFYAAIACAIVGALVALPALRLRGLYLALATMAFGVFVSRMVLTEIGEREIFGHRFSIFEGGSLTIPRPEIGPLDFKSNESFLMLVTFVFAIMAIGLVFVRKSNYGRRLAAMKDSPAACATLGMSVVRLKLSVFMLSAAIAGVGGVLMSAQLGSVNLDRFDIFLSLSILLITVVGGIGYTSGALFAGVLFGCSFLAMQNTLTKLGSDYSSLEAVFGFLVSAVTVLPATIGVTMGKNPSGAISDIVESLDQIKKSKPLMVTMIGLQVVIWALTAREIITPWHFVIFTAANLLLVPPIGGAILKGQAMKKLGIEPETPPEWIGIDRAFTDDDRIAMEHVLGLDAVPVPVGTPVHHEEGTAHALLETIDCKVRFGGNIALDDVSISVEPASVTGLIGPNGAGKTTLFNAITGLQSLSGGRVMLNGNDVTKLPPHKRARQGLARTFQRLELFTSLSVRDNVRVAGEIRNRWGVGRGRVDANAEADRIIELVGLSEVADREVGEIPTGQARVVELARALMIQPTLLLLDEPASGQTEDETEAFGVLLRKLATEDGLGICLVEHDMALVMQVCEIIHVLEFGRIIASGLPEDVRNDPAVIDAYLGAPESVG